MAHTFTTTSVSKTATCRTALIMSPLMFGDHVLDRMRPARRFSAAQVLFWERGEVGEIISNR